MPRLLLATTNPGKLAEYRQLLRCSAWELVTPQELGITLETPETGASYAENARRKAMEAAQRSGLVSLADDSGVEVDALNGEPGPRSARFAGEDAGDEANRRLLLARLAGVPAGGRHARFRCAIAIAAPGREPELVEGTVEGSIAGAPRGSGGFGYDPLFELPERGLTMAELPPEEKNRLSHRGRAAAGALPVLRRLLAADG